MGSEFYEGFLVSSRVQFEELVRIISNFETTSILLSNETKNLGHVKVESYALETRNWSLCICV